MPKSLQKVVANQDFSIDDIEKVEDIDRLLRITEILAMSMLGINLTETDSEILLKLLNFYKAPKN